MKDEDKPVSRKEFRKLNEKVAEHEEKITKITNITIPLYGLLIFAIIIVWAFWKKVDNANGVSDEDKLGYYSIPVVGGISLAGLALFFFCPCCSGSRIKDCFKDPDMKEVVTNVSTQVLTNLLKPVVDKSAAKNILNMTLTRRHNVDQEEVIPASPAKDESENNNGGALPSNSRTVNVFSEAKRKKKNDKKVKESDDESDDDPIFR